MLTPEQKEQRKHALGATDCAAVLGVSPYTTPYELWAIKTGRMDEPTILSDDRLYLRHAHEETIAREYARRKDCKLRRVNQTLVHKKYPFMICNLDRVVIGERRIVECKSSSSYMKLHWGESGSDIAPAQYILQVQHQLAVSEYDDAEIAALIDIDDYRIFPQPRNEKLIATIESECDRFWHEHVLADVPPEPVNRNDLKLMYPLNDGNFIEASMEVITYIEEHKTIKETMKNNQAEKERIEKEIIQFIASNDGIKLGDEIIATYKANKNGVRTLKTK